MARLFMEGGFVMLPILLFPIVMPALIAWTLLLVPANAAFVGFAALFATILYVDYRMLPLLDDRYRQLRIQLSVIVIVTLLVVAGFTASLSA